MTRARNTADEVSLITAKGDLLAGSASGVQSKLTVGSNNTVLTADSTAATGMKWASVATAKNFSLIGSAATTSGTTVTFSGISGMDILYIQIDQSSSANASVEFQMRFNSDSGANYYRCGPFIDTTATYSASNQGTFTRSGLTYFEVGETGASAAATVSGGIFVFGANTSGLKMFNVMCGGSNAAAGNRADFHSGFWNNSSTISSVSIISTSGNFDAGTIYVYGSA